jgi:DNA-binding NarL/FixJ family response regulator
VCLDASIKRVATTVLIVDDHLGFRARARALLESEGYAVIGEASSGASAVSAAIALRPDLVLLDVMLPDSTGFEVARRLCVLTPPPRVVLVSTRDASDFGPLVHTSKAIGFIPKLELSGRRLRQLLEAAS